MCTTGTIAGWREIMNESITTAGYHRVQFHGRPGQFFLIFLKNVFLSIITLGVYSFWARTNIEHFFYNNTSVRDGYFGWHVSGKERFLAFVKVIALYILVFGIVSFLPKVLPFLANPVFLAVLGIVALAVVFYIFPAIMIAMRRYYVSRTSWNNVRLSFHGKTTEFAKIFYLDLILSILTLGVYGFWMKAHIQQYYWSRTRAGKLEFDYDGKGFELFKIAFITILLFVPTLSIYTSWGIAKMTNYNYSHISVGGKKLQSDLTGGKVFLYFILAQFLVGITLGIYTFKYIVDIYKVTRECILVPDFNPADVTSAGASSGDAFGEALAETSGELLETIADFFS